MLRNTAYATRPSAMPRPRPGLRGVRGVISMYPALVLVLNLAGGEARGGGGGGGASGRSGGGSFRNPFKKDEDGQLDPMLYVIVGFAAAILLGCVRFTCMFWTDICHAKISLKHLAEVRAQAQIKRRTNKGDNEEPSAEAPLTPQAEYQKRAAAYLTAFGKGSATDVTAAGGGEADVEAPSPVAAQGPGDDDPFKQTVNLAFAQTTSSPLSSTTRVSPLMVAAPAEALAITRRLSASAAPDGLPSLGGSSTKPLATTGTLGQTGRLSLSRSSTPRDSLSRRPSNPGPAPAPPPEEPPLSPKRPRRLEPLAESSRSLTTTGSPPHLATQKLEKQDSFSAAMAKTQRVAPSSTMSSSSRAGGKKQKRKVAPASSDPAKAGMKSTYGRQIKQYGGNL